MRRKYLLKDYSLFNLIRYNFIFVIVLALSFALVNVAKADDAVTTMPHEIEGGEDQSKSEASLPPQWYSLHAQGTFNWQGHPGFHSAIPDGVQSMKSSAQSTETSDLTAYLGAHVGKLELYANPEIDQGLGLSNTYGAAGYVSGESGKVGVHKPYFHLARLFGRYVVDLGGEMQTIEDDINQVAGQQTANNLTFTFGKFSVVDVFDTNSYAHDARNDFLNWSMIDMGAFDYAAEAWGYTYGGTAEWTQNWWTLRAGLFDLSQRPNEKYLVHGFGQNQIVTEAEERHEIFGQSGKAKALFFLTSANMGSYTDALTFARETNSIPDTALVRHRQSRLGGGLNFEHQIMPELGSFLRFSMNDGTKEAYEFTEINRSMSGGLSLKGGRWHRPDDTIGLGGAFNTISKQAQSYLAAGGQGILIGDGQLPSYDAEQIIEAYYKATLVPGLALAFDYQRMLNPAYDAARGPINFFALRLHANF